MDSTAPSSHNTKNYTSYQSICNDPSIPIHIERAIDTTEPKSNLCQAALSAISRFFSVLFSLRLELITFLYALFHNLTKISSTTFILDKVCLVNFGYPEEVCSNLQNFTEIKPDIEILANNYQLGHTLIQIAPAALLGCFIGPWSDIYGRKFPVVIALAGMALDNFGSVICAYYMNSRVEYFYIPAIFTGISGGSVTLLAVTYSYASDTSEYSHRTLKYAYVEMASGLAAPLGSTAGGWIYEFFGYVPVFITGGVGMLMTLLLMVVILSETTGLDNHDSWTLKLKRLFSCATFKEGFIATSKDRPYKGKLQIILLISSLCLVVITNTSTGGINYLYVHHQFDWSNAEYSTIIALYSVCAMLLLVVIIPLYKYWKVGDPALGIIGTTSQLGKCIGVGFSTRPGLYHAACLFGLLMACAPLAARSRISKLCSIDDLGKIFSFVAAAESLLPIMTTALTSQLFNLALDTFPGLPYIVLAVLLLFPFSVFIWLACLPSYDYETLHGKNSKSAEEKTIVSI